MNDRLKICIQCEKYNHEKQTCGKCNCYMPLKTTLPFMKCPIGKW